MIKSIENYLSIFGDLDKKILDVFEKVDRKDFMDVHKHLAYEDNAISIRYNQTISQPSTVARMISLLELKKTDKVL
jgi:protein-L-isoaspartate(D-aspartate) O-methyltransferase